MMANQGGRDQRPGQGGRDQRSGDGEEKQFDERVVHIDRVARVVKGGRRFHFRALVAVGDHKGKIGIGVSKGVDVTSAVTKAVGVAKKNMILINMYNETIPHETEAKIGGSRILVKPAAPGTGLIAGGVVRTILEVVGVRNALSKSLGSNSKINSAYATLAALQAVEVSSDWISNIPDSHTKFPAVAASPAKTIKAIPAKPDKVETKAKTVKKPAKVAAKAKASK